MPIVIAIAVLIASLLIWWRFFYIARPKMPPLSIADDDPLMQEAVRKAQASIARLRELFAQPHRGARVKVPFDSNSGTREFLWAEIRQLRESDAEVLYLTPPVTHTGRIERIHTYPIADLVDWQIECADGHYEGGFTMRVMFVRGREQWGDLPPDLKTEERKYGGSTSD